MAVIAAKENSAFVWIFKSETRRLRLGF